MGHSAKNRRPSRWASLGALLLLVILTTGLPSGVPGVGQLAAVQAAASHDRFNAAVWEVVHVLQLLPGPFQTMSASAVDDYFALASEVRAAETNLQQRLAIAGTTNTPEVSQALALRDRLRNEMEALRPMTERSLGALVGDVLTAQGLVLDIPLLGPRLFPPIAFTLEQLPRALIVSHRDRIEVLEIVHLRPNITETEIEALESTLRRRDLSVTVEPLGGLSTYPTLVKPDADLRFTLATIAHEWVHHYLFFQPLGQRHNISADMTTINETVADIIGNEIAALVLGETPPTQRIPGDANDDAPKDPDAFDANRFLRETRLTAEALLREGRVDDAEAYMEQRRRELAEHGIFIRNLNQAYFAFYGSYADQPGAISPIFGQLTDLRRASASLSDFLRRVQSIRTPTNLTDLTNAAAPSHPIAASTPRALG